MEIRPLDAQTEGVAEVDDRVNRGRTTRNYGLQMRYRNRLCLQISRAVDAIIAPRCRGKASMGDHHSGGICRDTPNDAWASRALID